MSSHEKAEAQIAKTSNQSNDSSHAFHNEYVDSMRNAFGLGNGGAKHETNLLNLPKLAIDGISAEFKKEGDELWKGLDKNPTTHFIKHDYCNDEPLKVGVAVAGIAAVGAIAAVAAAPELAAAGAAYSIGTVLAAASGTANIVLFDDYQKRQASK